MKQEKKLSRPVQNRKDLEKIRVQAKKRISPDTTANTTRVLVGMGTCGLAAGGQQVFDAMKEEIERLGLSEVELVPTGCVGICQFEPVVEVYTTSHQRTTYVKMTPERGVRVVQQHLQGGNTLAEFTIGSCR